MMRLPRKFIPLPSRTVGINAQRAENAKCLDHLVSPFGRRIKGRGIWMIIVTIVCLSTSIKAQNNGVKIYSVKDTVPLWDKKYRSEIYWGFYKIDFDKETIQSKGFAFREGDKAPDLTNVNNLFKEEPKDYFEVISPTKIKVRRIKGTRVKRAWNDFATAGRTGGSPAETYFIIGDTLQRKDWKLKYVLDKDLTERIKK